MTIFGGGEGVSERLLRMWEVIVSVARKIKGRKGGRKVWLGVGYESGFVWFPLRDLRNK